MHTYLLIYEWYPRDKGLFKLHDKIATYKCKGVANENSWLIVSNKTAKEIYEDFLPFFPKRFLFVTEIILEHSAGYLWDEGCNWIKNNVTNPYLKELDIRQQ
ncbi:hypothetical protein Ga0466249_005340 [Sporomusaceae bacterium BoRhaA]|uniref:hypothetical protein n=1 Tax=Pelorhabdus rhamnosifermentans TaxID=2772457 RepID=UPI001C060D8E|nr:hypothetical protein [Pelorhabdus rhamnosifermentans]MBU2704186.1 hypothetical protein [Pelorhabdus rhamnosifermentans]